MNNDKESFRPDGTVEQQKTTPDNVNTEQNPFHEDSVIDKKDERQSFQDYNGNSESNAPARARDGGEQ